MMTTQQLKTIQTVNVSTSSSQIGAEKSRFMLFTTQLSSENDNKYLLMNVWLNKEGNCVKSGQRKTFRE